MNIEGIEINCGACNTSIGINDDCYCEGCLEEKDDEIKALEKRIESLEGELSACETEVMDLKKESE